MLDLSSNLTLNTEIFDEMGNVLYPAAQLNYIIPLGLVFTNNGDKYRVTNCYVNYDWNTQEVIVTHVDK